MERRARETNRASTDAETSAARATRVEAVPAARCATRARTATPGTATSTIAHAGGGLTIRFDKTPALSGTLEHWQHDTFVAQWTDRELRADAFVTFALNPDGTIDTAKMRAVSPDTDFSFDFQDLLFRSVR